MTGTSEGKDPSNGRFLPGNRFWEARSSHGRSPIFETADQLEDACHQYFEWVAENPLYKDQLVTFQGQATHEPVALMRAMTAGALCMFIGVEQQTWIAWRKDRPDFSKVIAWAEQTIYQQKFEGASADLLNANIIARDLGLADKKDLTSSDGSMTPGLNLTNVSDDALREIMAARNEPKPE